MGAEHVRNRGGTPPAGAQTRVEASRIAHGERRTPAHDRIRAPRASEETPRSAREIAVEEGTMSRLRSTSIVVLSLFLAVESNVLASGDDLPAAMRFAVRPEDRCTVAGFGAEDRPREPRERPLLAPVELARDAGRNPDELRVDAPVIAARDAASRPPFDAATDTDGTRASSCVPAWTLECGDSDSWANDGEGGTDVELDYACIPWPESGPEFTYSFSSPATTQVTVDLTDLSADLDLFALSAPGGVCSGSNCDAFSASSGLASESLTFTASAGEAYFLVVDGYADSVGSYQIAVSCAPACAPAWDLRCGASDSWANDQTGSTNAMTDYSCVPWSESGPEYAYRFSAAEPVRVTIDLTGLTADLDLMVLASPGGTCSGSNCVAASSVSGTAAESVTFTALADATYAVVVDGYGGATSPYQITVACRAVIFDDDFESGSVNTWTTHVP